jgi:amino acid transporter
MATKDKPWSVGSLMKFSMYAAVNFAVFHAVGRADAYSVVFLLAVLNLLFFWFSRWNRERTNRRFWDWFELIGWGMLGLSVTFADSSCNLIIAPLNWLVDRQWIKREGAVSTALFFLGASVVYGLFPLALATLAGWLASRNGRLIGRQPEAEG